MNLFEKNAFDYWDFINNEIFSTEVRINLLEEMLFELHPATVQSQIIECNISLQRAKAMLKIPEKELKKGAKRWGQSV